MLKNSKYVKSMTKLKTHYLKSINIFWEKVDGKIGEKLLSDREFFNNF